MDFVVKLAGSHGRCHALGLRVNKGVNIGWNIDLDYLLALLKGVSVSEGFNMLDAEDQVVRHRLQKIGLVLQSKVLTGITTEDCKSVQSPVDLFC